MCVCVCACVCMCVHVCLEHGEGYPPPSKLRVFPSPIMKPWLGTFYSALIIIGYFYMLLYSCSDYEFWD